MSLRLLILCKVCYNTNQVFTLFLYKKHLNLKYSFRRDDMEGAATNNNTKSLIEFSVRYERKTTILWAIFGIGLTYLRSSKEDQSWLDTKIRNDIVPTRCDVGFFKWYHTELGDENQQIPSYEPEKGPNAIINAVKSRSKRWFKEFPGFVELVDACADIKNAAKNLGFKEEGVVVCPTHVELDEDVLLFHITCYVPQDTGNLYANKVKEYISQKYQCGCVIYRRQNP